MSTDQPFANLVRPNNDVPHRFRTTLQPLKHSEELYFKQRMQVLMTTVAHERGLVPHALEVDLAPTAGHVAELLRVRHDGCKGLRHLVDVKEPEDQVPESRAELDFRLDERAAVAIERGENEALHLVSELSKTGEDVRRNRNKELRS